MIQQQLAEAAASGAIMVTANKRLARAYRRLYDEHARASGRTAWPQLNVLPWTAWVRTVWIDGVMAARIPPAVLLNRDQCEGVWRAIVEESPESARLLQLRATAVSAMSAWSLIHRHRIPWKRIGFAGHEDWAAFAGWARLYERRCDANNWIDEPKLSSVLIDVFQVLDGPQKVLLGGFDEFTPQQTALLETLKSQGCDCSSINMEAAPQTTAQRIELIDPITELRAAAQWAFDLQRRAPRSRIGIVIPALASLRGVVERVFTEVFDPGRILDVRADKPKFHVSIGPALADYPMIHAALELLRFTRGVLSLAESGSLLRSPFIAGAEAEASERALLDARIRRKRPADVSLQMLRQENRHCPQLAEALENWDRLRHAAPNHQGSAAWAATFPALLAAMGWPGGRAHDSTEHQILQAWTKLLDRFASLDILRREYTQDQAAAKLFELAATTEFQPEDSDAPVQVTGTLEAAGATYDHLWIARLQDGEWPVPAHPHPFLPPALQIEYNLPHCSAEREYAFAERTTARLLVSAPDVVVSYAKRDGERDLRPSPLIRDLPRAEWYVAQDAWSAALDERVILEELADWEAPPLANYSPAGGTNILKYQAQCPFRAFGQLRLGARALERGSLGVDAAGHGNALHKALELFWREVGSHARLMELESAELASLIRAVSAKALPLPAISALEQRFHRLECERLEHVLLDWIEIEKARPPFTVVQEERERRIAIGGLEISTRIDRVDQLDSGGLIVIDYKTTAPSLKSWEGERIEEPQVPLYAAYMEEGVAAAAFAQLTPGDLKFKGIADSAALPGVKAFNDPGGLHETVDGWRSALTSLAQEFRRGNAVVDPKKDACQFCGLTALCRVNESGPTTSEDSGDV